MTEIIVTIIAVRFKITIPIVEITLGLIAGLIANIFFLPKKLIEETKD